ncbi:MAG: hypothetical protein CSA96_04480 [Bacteroidetes bacterium]|nr:MAG: hypothetical protein CSA96_04480 [Bacteroidota bacterium]
MNWRKLNRSLHRDLGYLFFGMCLVYGVSGIALNHGVSRHWDPGLIHRTARYQYPGTLQKASFGKEELQRILKLCGEEKSFKQFYFPDEEHAMLYLKGGHIEVNLADGSIHLTRIRNRPVFRELNYLHYNKPRKLWTWFSDLFALSLILLAITGIFITKGKKGLKGRGAVLVLIGIAIPLLFLSFYLWF